MNHGANFDRNARDCVWRQAGDVVECAIGNFGQSTCVPSSAGGAVPMLRDGIPYPSWGLCATRSLRIPIYDVCPVRFAPSNTVFKTLFLLSSLVTSIIICDDSATNWRPSRNLHGHRSSMVVQHSSFLPSLVDNTCSRILIEVSVSVCRKSWTPFPFGIHLYSTLDVRRNNMDGK